MPVGAFDIYQTAAGYVAVVNPTRRQILNVLADGDQELTGLVEVTGKAKPTLSSVHMRYLVETSLVAAAEHPKDHRRKVYRLVAQKIGSSDLPLSQLREAVNTHIPGGATGPCAIATVIETLAAAPAETEGHVLHSQACRFGALTGRSLTGHDASGLMLAAMNLLAEQDIARLVHFDAAEHRIDLDLGPALPSDVPPQRLADILAGLVEGMGREGGWIDGLVQATLSAGNRQCRLGWS